MWEDVVLLDFQEYTLQNEMPASQMLCVQGKKLANYLGEECLLYYNFIATQ